MTTPASIARHPIHPALVAFPIGLWVFSLVADLVHHWAGGSVFWKDVAFYTMLGGLIGALAAAVPGLIDFLSLRETTVRRLGTYHLVLNLTVVALYAINLLVRRGGDPFATGPVWLSAASIVLLVVSGWIGGELVHVHGVSVVEPAGTRPVTIAVEPGGAAARDVTGRASGQ